jgi:hypothetical protein
MLESKYFQMAYLFIIVKTNLIQLILLTFHFGAVCHLQWTQ